MHQIFLQTILPFFVSLAIQFIVIKTFKKKEFCIDCEEADKPQRFHFVPTPRAGGLGIFIAFTSGILIYSFNSSLTPPRLLLVTHSLSLIMSSFPAFFAGFYEDMKANINPRLRLFIISIGAVSAIVLMNSVIYDIGFLGLPIWLAVPFSIFAMVGITNAINIIDGFNGLASGVSMVAFLSFALVSYLCGDYFILTLTLTLTFSILGFFILNFPVGKIFLGDGGAYFIGFMLAEISILLVNRNPEISPWFPVAVLAYPIFETFFSIYRRKFARGLPAFSADAIHLHTLIFRRITRSNPKTSVYVWVLVVSLNLIAFPFRSNTPILVLICVLFSACYMFIYRRIVRFKING